jgi:hypothetical protein
VDGLGEGTTVGCGLGGTGAGDGCHEVMGEGVHVGDGAVVGATVGATLGEVEASHVEAGDG